MHTQVDQVIALIVGWVLGVIAFVFDVPAPAIFAAFIGCSFGVAFSKPLSYLKAIVMVVIGTIAAGFLLPWVTHFLGLGEVPQRGLSFALGFVLIKYREQIISFLDTRVKKRLGESQ